MTLKIVPGSLLLFLYGSRLLMLLLPILRGSWVLISAYLSASPAFSADGLADFQSFMNPWEHGNTAETIGGEGGRCAEVRANRREKHEKAGAIEWEKEGPRRQL